jgi:hypothetical protein
MALLVMIVRMFMVIMVATVIMVVPFMVMVMIRFVMRRVVVRRLAMMMFVIDQICSFNSGHAQSNGYEENKNHLGSPHFFFLCVEDEAKATSV